MKKEDLLKERFKVVADYPKSDFPLGTILSMDVESAIITLNGEYQFSDKWPMALTSSYYVKNVLKVENYPHLFRKLEWYEERKVEDMPEYVKNVKSEVILKVKKWEWDNDEDAENELFFTSDGDELGQYPRQIYIPATLEEYTTYLTTLSPTIVQNKN